MKTVHVKVRYAGNGYTARAGSGKTAKTVSCTHSPSVAAQRAAAKFFELDTSKAEQAIDVAGRFDHATGGIYVATLLEAPVAKAEAPAASLADTFFDNSLRVENVIWLAALTDQPPEVFSDFVERSDSKSTTKLVTDLLGITAKRWDQIASSEDSAEASILFARAGKEGFLVQVATPCPVAFHESGGITTYGFGFCTMHWFYTEALDTAFVDVVVKWKEDYYAAEKEKHAAKAKKEGA